MKKQMLSILEGNKTNLSSRQFVGRDLPHPLLLGQEEKQPCFTRDVEDPRQRPSGMTFVFYNDNSMGFTLIELLVVVLIIGILAAVALPQYRLAVDKARLANLVAMTKNVVEAQEAYYLANNTYTKDWDELAVTLPGTVNSNVMSSTDGWTIRLLKEGGGAVNGLTAEDSRVPDVLLYAFYDHNTVPEEFYGMMCYVSRSNAHAVKLCKNMSQSKNAISGNDSQLVYRFE